MQFKTIFTVLATATLALGAALPEPAPEAVAVPVAGYPEPASYPPPSGGEPGKQYPPLGSSCGSQQEKVSCCNGGGKGDGNGQGGGLLAGIGLGVGNLLGGSCSLSVLGGSCNTGSVACCPTVQGNGGGSLISIGSVCAPITL